MNSRIIKLFTDLSQQIQAEYLNAKLENNDKEITSHNFRLKSIKNILSIIKKLDFEITDVKQLDNIAGIGKSTKKRIQEIIETGNLMELVDKYDKKKQSKISSIIDLENVIGIGSTNAKKFVVDYGITSVEQLKNAIKTGKITVNNTIMLGLKYHNIVERNIPRREIDKIAIYLEKNANTIDKDFHSIICGSYRRGKKTSGDIDVLFFNHNVVTGDQLLHPQKYKLQPHLKLLIEKLKTNGFLLDDLTHKNYDRKYMGFCKYKSNPVRRIDIRYVPYKSLATAMLYFTGPYELNTEMRTAAKKRGLILNEYGLYKIDKTKKNNIGESLNVTTENDIFKILGMDYLTPQEREKFSS